MIPFNDLKPVHAALAEELSAATRRVLDSGWFILGPEVEAFESEFAAYHGVKHAVGVANGTDAIELALRAAGIGPGAEVITVAHTAVATITAIERTGAVPVMVDINPQTYVIDPAAVEAAITPRTAAIVPVHLYGHMTDVERLSAIAEKNDLLLMEDCAQAHGARWHNRLAGTTGHVASFSFYPTKNLGALGDGGAIITKDDTHAANLRRLRNYGQTSRYYHAERGVNSRLDEMQAALLRVKLKHLDEHNSRRREVAALYNAGLEEVIKPVALDAAYHVYHLYVVRHSKRDALMAALQQRGVGTLIHYPIPNHLQEGYTDLGYKSGSLPITERIAEEIVSLPLYIGLENAAVENVIKIINAVAGELS